MVKTYWSRVDDERLIEYVERYGARDWKSVAENLGFGRSGSSCSQRYKNYLAPERNLGVLTEQEKTTILDLHRVLGNKWATIAKFLPGRSDNAVKNFYYAYNGKLARQLRDEEAAAVVLSDPPNGGLINPVSGDGVQPTFSSPNGGLINPASGDGVGFPDSVQFPWAQGGFVNTDNVTADMYPRFDYAINDSFYDPLLPEQLFSVPDAGGVAFGEAYPNPPPNISFPKRLGIETVRSDQQPGVQPPIPFPNWVDVSNDDIHEPQPLLAFEDIDFFPNQPPQFSLPEYGGVTFPGTFGDVSYDQELGNPNPNPNLGESMWDY